MEMHLVRRQSVDFAFGDREALENSDGFLFHPIRERARRNELPDLGESAAVGMG